jgi:hypothetical protein
MATGAPPSSSGISDAQLETLMATMRQGVKDELAVMKRELSTEREAADEKLVKKIKLEKAPSFRKTGHEKQFRHVQPKLTEARSALDEQPAAVEKAKQLLEEGEKIIDEHIKIVDRSGGPRWRSMLRMSSFVFFKETTHEVEKMVRKPPQS